MGGSQLPTAGFEDGGRGPKPKERGWLPEAGDIPQLARTQGPQNCDNTELNSMGNLSEKIKKKEKKGEGEILLWTLEKKHRPEDNLILAQ